MKLHVDYEWSVRKLEEDDADECAAGVPLETLSRTGLSPTRQPAPAIAGAAAAEAVPGVATLGALGLLINMLRRRDHLTLDETATRGGVDLGELLRIEREEHYKPRPRTVSRLAALFKVPVDQLSKVAGIKIAEDPTLQQATLKFAAHSEQMTQLTKVERDALTEYLAVLTRSKK